MKIIYLYILILGTTFISCTVPVKKKRSDNKPEQIVRSFNDGSYHIYQVDNKGLEHGFYKIYNGYKQLISESRYYHGKEVSRSFFVNNKKVEHNVFFIPVKSINVCVKYDYNGNIIKKDSRYANINFKGKNNDSLMIELSEYYTDSIVVLFRKSFHDNDDLKDFLRRKCFIKPQSSVFTIDIKEEDYWEGKLNIQVSSYDKVYYEKFKGDKIKIKPTKEMLIQLDRGERPKKYNLDPIW